MLAATKINISSLREGTPPPTGVEYMRVEVTSHGQGINLQYGFPQASFKLAQWFKYYKIPLKSFGPASWIQDHAIQEC